MAKLRGPFLPCQPNTQPRFQQGSSPPASQPLHCPQLNCPQQLLFASFALYSLLPPESSTRSHSLHSQRVHLCSLLAPTATPHQVRQTLGNSIPFKSFWFRILSKAFHQINRQKHTSPLSFKCLFSANRTLPISPYFGCSVTLVTLKEKKWDFSPVEILVLSPFLKHHSRSCTFLPSCSTHALHWSQASPLCHSWEQCFISAFPVPCYSSLGKSPP